MTMQTACTDGIPSTIAAAILILRLFKFSYFKNNGLYVQHGGMVSEFLHCAVGLNGFYAVVKSNFNFAVECGLCINRLISDPNAAAAPAFEEGKKSGLCSSKISFKMPWFWWTILTVTDNSINAIIFRNFIGETSYATLIRYILIGRNRRSFTQGC